MVTLSSARGVRLGDGLQLLGSRRVHITLLFLVSTLVTGLYFIPANAQAPAPQGSDPTNQTFTIFEQYEANALDSIRQNWTQQNEELSRVLNWTASYQHPCNVSAYTAIDVDYSYEGAWSGVVCTPILRTSNVTGNYYDVSVTRLHLYGSNSSCSSDPVVTSVDYPQCDFTGIKGVLPPAIGNLTNLESLVLVHNPKLTGPVPMEIWKLPNLVRFSLYNNSLIGTLPTSDDLNTSSYLQVIRLNNNNFSGSVRVSSQGTLFSSSLDFLDLSYNQLNGTVDLRGLNSNGSSALNDLRLNNNNFSGTFSTGPSLDPTLLDLSYNAFTDIKFANYTGDHSFTRLNSTVYMPSLSYFYVNNNQLSGPFPMEIVGSSLLFVHVNGNKYSGSLDFRGLDNITLNCTSMNFSNNNFDGSFFSGHTFNPKVLDLSNNNFRNISFDVYNGTTDIYMPSLESLYIQNNNFSGQFPDFVSETSGLQILNMENNNFSGKFPEQILKAPLLHTLNMENNKFNGEFPEQLLKAPGLKTLYAGQNYFSILQLPEIKYENLTIYEGIFLTNNSITEVQYARNEGPFTQNNLLFSNYLFLGGNPYCNNINSLLLSRICRMNPDQATLSLNDAHKFSTQTKIIIGTSISTFGIILLIIALYVWRLMGRIQTLGIILKEFEKKEVKPNLYSYKDIKLATNNFDKQNKIGEGGFGVVYKGELLDGTVVAVKKLTMSSSQMLSEFLNEIVVISGLKHRNLVKLKGCCLGDGDQRMLVFEYVENKNLAEALLLHGDILENFEPPSLDWAARFNIIVGIARGLLYLHEDSESPVIHRDIKATNILLDKDYNAKIADFGLAYLFPTLDSEETHLTLMQVAGTRGYCSPEYAVHGHISTALDVYSFGILILEIISGRKCIDSQKSGDEVYLREWAWKLFEGGVLITLIDSKMKHSPSDLEAIARAISVALACVQYKTAKRPKMHDVIPMLLGNMPIGDLHVAAEGGEVLGGVASSSSTTRSDTTSSLWENDQRRIDECSLLSDIHEIELSARG
ncbi:hypothetical protein KC19_6G208400 [Ceratodon purpureus]|uniref:non-specific serine/threonine protein kinase n=1 Tax=Ceratodon purpureus TaxID=3225 RepID=A0A8T0HJX6_CERPU|nr:hypothetical protein KC19_6G208400 [Ceratodon purpureus]